MSGKTHHTITAQVADLGDDEQHGHAEERGAGRFRRIEVIAGGRLVVDPAPFFLHQIQVQNVVLDDRPGRPDG